MLKLDSFKSINADVKNVIGGKAPTTVNDQPNLTYKVDGINGDTSTSGGTSAGSNAGGITFD
ncbi:MAG TPA: hypothetical protein PKD51_09240 [Saprospiraceae bacterium]|mgnify:CR=1 FL=1|nr:hypothetical protein [Saprospiraceae bacterium]HMU03665.1 hypothetical protein [Saprospiraceae bacterium]